MKIKILFLGFICIATLLSLFFSKEKQLHFILTLDNIESLAEGEDGQYSCTASTDCYNMIGQKDGSVSCSGNVCSRGSDWSGKRWVECDGNKTYC